MRGWEMSEVQEMWLKWTRKNFLLGAILTLLPEGGRYRARKRVRE